MKCRDFYGEIHDIPKEEIRTRASIYGIIFNEDKTKVLLVKHLDGFDYPGGGLKVGQQINDTLEREILEETGYELKKTPCNFWMFLPIFFITTSKVWRSRQF